MSPRLSLIFQFSPLLTLSDVNSNRRSYLRVAIHIKMQENYMEIGKWKWAAPAALFI